MPGTIGAITWLATHRDEAARIEAGLVLTGLGDDSPLTFKRSRCEESGGPRPRRRCWPTTTAA